MSLDTMQDLLVEQVKDLYSAETQITGQDTITGLLDQSLAEEVAADQKLTGIAESEVNPQAVLSGAEDEEVG